MDANQSSRRRRGAGPTDPRLPELLRAARLAEEYESAALAELNAGIARLRVAYDAAGALPQGEMLDGGFAQSGGLTRWDARVRQRRRQINIELAGLLAARPGRESRVRHAISRRLALEKLIGGRS